MKLQAIYDKMLSLGTSAAVEKYFHFNRYYGYDGSIKAVGPL